MKKLICLALICMMSTASALAKEYDLTPKWSWEDWDLIATNSPCPNSGFYTDGLSSYKCSSNVTLNEGDSIIAGPYTSTLYLERYSTFKGNNTIGSASRNLSLDLERNSFTANGQIGRAHV